MTRISKKLEELPTKKICGILHVLRICEYCKSAVWSQPSIKLLRRRHSGKYAFVCRECIDGRSSGEAKMPIRRKEANDKNY